ncbi:hypothetical protein K438DRAFT_1782414 [Mycena galopus ATCC 62051]|nr:hypothetical protein K438DRAFT_1782414 [Mycena galopus ATCC 62051]
MDIPPDIEDLLLPPQYLSVWDFASFELPRARLAVPPHAGSGQQASDFLIQAPAVPLAIHPHKICALLTPRDILVNALIRYAKNSLLHSDTTVVRCLHLPADNGAVRLMPLFILTYWQRVKNLRLSRLKWAHLKQRAPHRALEGVPKAWVPSSDVTGLASSPKPAKPGPLRPKPSQARRRA